MKKRSIDVILTAFLSGKNPAEFSKSLVVEAAKKHPVKVLQAYSAAMKKGLLPRMDELDGKIVGSPLALFLTAFLGTPDFKPWAIELAQAEPDFVASILSKKDLVEWVLSNWRIG